ncbi:MAG TPA: hypothetical protein VKV96_15385 [Roseiarcus sp.]|nr:hypothetical protein [Roseiarcus sp.]
MTLWRARWRLAAWWSVCVAATLIYALSVPAQYVAHVNIAIAPRAIANDGPEDVRHFHQINLDAEQASTELQVLKSERLLRPVFENLGLATIPELSRWSDGFWSTLARYVHSLASDGSPYNDRQRAYFAFVDRVRCLRLGMSYVFEISYRSHNPNLAARIVNALAAEYLADRIERERIRQARIGGAYQAARGETLTEQFLVSRLAAKAGVAPTDNLFAASAHLLGTAAPPLAKSYPRTGATLALGAGIGFLSGVLAALWFGVHPRAASRNGREARV